MIVNSRFEMIEMTAISAGDEVISDEVIGDVDDTCLMEYLSAWGIRMLSGNPKNTSMGGGELNSLLQLQNGFQPLDQQMFILRTVGI